MRAPAGLKASTVAPGGGGGAGGRDVVGDCGDAWVTGGTDGCVTVGVDAGATEVTGA